VSEIGGQLSAKALVSSFLAAFDPHLFAPRPDGVDAWKMADPNITPAEQDRMWQVVAGHGVR
jgi:hypothetical protein